MKVLVLVCACFAFATAGVKKLTPEQVERLKNWKETDKQNIWELSGQYQGDIVFKDDVSDYNGLIFEQLRWPNKEIPYAFGPGLTEEQKLHINASLSVYLEKSCVVPRPKTDADKDYILITNQESGCFSYVGFEGGIQQINFQSNVPGEGCFRSGTIVHEFLHALGFYHEQSSTERDDYVTIVWENISEGHEHNFDKYGDNIITNFGEGYDYGSVMHYSAYGFSKNGEKTIVTLDPNAEIGQRDGLSEIDVAKLNKMYKCDEQ